MGQTVPFVSKAELAAGIESIKAIAEAIRDLESVPSGHLYARLMTFASLESYETVITMLVKAEVIRKENDLLIWNV
jgi:hypothetical protein